MTRYDKKGRTATRNRVFLKGLYRVDAGVPMNDVYTRWWAMTPIPPPFRPFQYRRIYVYTRRCVDGDPGGRHHWLTFWCKKEGEKKGKKRGKLTHLHKIFLWTRCINSSQKWCKSTVSSVRFEWSDKWWNEHSTTWWKSYKCNDMKFLH